MIDIHDDETELYEGIKLPGSNRLKSGETLPMQCIRADLLMYMERSGIMHVCCMSG